MDVVQIASTIASLGAVFSVLYLLRDNRRKLRADTSEAQSRAAGSLSESYEALLERTNKDVVKLRREITEIKALAAATEAAQTARIDALEAQNHRLHVWSQLLFTQVVEAGGEPIPFESVPEYPDLPD